MALIALIQRANLRSRGAQIALVAARRLRRLAVLRRRHDHARDLRAVGGRGPGGRLAGPEGAGGADHADRADRAVRGPALRHRRGRRLLRADHVRVVRRAGGRGLARAARAPGDPRRALAPSRRSSSSFNHGHEAFVALGGVVLAVTGAEALYADMGHFGASAIRRAWFALVFPALTLNYLGQGALILEDPATASPFFLLFPRVGADPDGGPLDGRRDHRLPGGDLRRVLGHPPGDPARLPAAPGRPPHLTQGGGAGLRAGRQLDHLRRGRRARGRLRLLRAARLGLRHRGHRHAGDRHGPVLLRRARALAPADGARRRRRRRRSCSSTSRSSPPT